MRNINIKCYYYYYYYYYYYFVKKETRDGITNN